MPRGGHREKAGRPSTWKSGCRFSETKLVRVPTAIADQVLEIAHKIDSGETLDSVTKSKEVSDNVLQIIKRWSEKNKTISPKTGKWTAAKKLIKELEDALESDQKLLKIDLVAKSKVI